MSDNYQEQVKATLRAMSTKEIQKKIAHLEHRIETRFNPWREKVVLPATQKLLALYGDEMFERLLLEEDKDGV